MGDPRRPGENLPVITALLIGLTVILAWAAPRIMARQTIFRRSPRAALFAWQAVTLAAIIAGLAAAPTILPIVLFDGQAIWQHGILVLIGVAVSLLLLARLLLAGHHIGTRMRELRREHRELVDIIARQDNDHRGLRILEHPTPTAYCLPGRHQRVVLSRGALDALDPEEFAAVLTHERAHLRARHDLLVEFFSVIHETVPAPLRSQAAMREVRLLVEVLADRSAVREVGAPAMQSALLALSGARAPEAAMSMNAVASAPVRIDLLQRRSSALLSVVIYGYAALLLLLPVGLFAAAWA